tara:strand:- start:472 stop:906 length:435 start_codon:yes stop_codon:yes gene_type:complete
MVLLLERNKMSKIDFAKRWEYFTVNELECRGTGECHMQEDFMSMLVNIRREIDRPLIVSSGYRSPAHNARIGGAANSPHIHGRAVDIVCMGTVAYNLIRISLKHGMTGIGVSQKGPAENRFIHIDNIAKGQQELLGPRPWVWSY